jgi:hypothetical protein
MARYSLLLIYAFGALTACKGDTVVKPDPQTVSDLDACHKTVEEKDKLIKAEEEQIASLMRDKGNGATITLAIEGNALTVRPARPGEARPIDDKVAAAASKQFIDLVTKSRGAIQKCYEQELKKNTGMQAHTVTLTVEASFSQTGQIQSSGFAPQISNTFDNCLKTIAGRWALPTNATSMTFKAQVSLTPS